MSHVSSGGDPLLGGSRCWLLSLEVLEGEEVLRYVSKRLLMLIGIVFIISVGSFYLIHLLPGNITVVSSPAGSA